MCGRFQCRHHCQDRLQGHPGNFLLGITKIPVKWRKATDAIPFLGQLQGVDSSWPKLGLGLVHSIDRPQAVDHMLVGQVVAPVMTASRPDGTQGHSFLSRPGPAAGGWLGHPAPVRSHLLAALTMASISGCWTIFPWTHSKDIADFPLHLVSSFSLLAEIISPGAGALPQKTQE